MEKNEKLVLIDGNSLINRAFYALPLLSNSQGEYSNAVYGFCNMLTKLIEAENPKYIRFTIRLDEKTNSKLEAYAEKNEITVAEAIRCAIRRMLRLK